jgi:hypothetical protein
MENIQFVVSFVLFAISFFLFPKWFVTPSGGAVSLLTSFIGLGMSVVSIFATQLGLIEVGIDSVAIAIIGTLIGSAMMYIAHGAGNIIREMK